MKNKFYITTAIDYVNSLPHVGTAYEKIGTDVLARWHRLLGEEVRFQMGNDEHSVNVERAAVERGLKPKVYCDEMRGKFEKIWKDLDISYDGFIQTSDPAHEEGVKKFLKIIMDNGDIRKQLYEGWYCESCEAFLTEKDIVEGLCPNHRSKPKWLSEENYFFTLSKYRDKLLKHINDEPEFIQPEARRNEILALLKEGLQDISVSRSSFEWGIKIPNDPDHVIYVWFDALINYITAVGYGWDEKMFKKWWPAEMHVIGKDITRFHCVIWPAMLMSAGIKLPKTIFGHGFVYLKGEKMSKTIGNVVTPMDVIHRFGADPLRYYLMREGGFGRDADFTWEHFIERYNGDLANGLGNLVSRTIGMALRYQDGAIEPVKKANTRTEVAEKIKELPAKFSKALDYSNGEIEFHNALAAIWEVLAAADRHINENKPWEMAKAGKKEELNCVLWEIASAVRVCAILLGVFIPKTAAKVWQSFGFDSIGKFEKQTFEDALKPWGALNKTVKTKIEQNLFPRIESPLTPSPRLRRGDRPLPQGERETKEGILLEEEKKVETKTETKVEAATSAAQAGLIDITEFSKVELRVAEITQAEKVEGADRLLKLQVNLGAETRQIVAGIAKHYAPEELVGKKVVVVANLKPAILRGVESNGMLLAASDENTISILTPLKDVAIGSKVK